MCYFIYFTNKELEGSKLLGWRAQSQMEVTAKTK